MKITKKLEAEVLKAYHAYWDSYLKGDMKTMASLMDDDIKVIGSTETEVFYSKKTAMKFYSATAGQIAGSAQLRNRDIKIELIDGLILITEKLDFYALMDGKWTFYAKGRLSSLLRKKEDGWKVIQQHGSMPDTRAGEGEQLSVKKISKENQELREAVKRRTVELEHSNDELKIESALERVRTVAMAMQQPDVMLDVCQIISTELENLGVTNIRNIQTAIIDVSKDSYVNYEYFRLQKKKLVTAVEYKKHKEVHAFVKKMMKDPDGFFTTQFKGVPLKKYIQYMVKAGQFVDPATIKTASLHYYFYSIGAGALGISTYAPLTKEAIALFKRFRNVFQLAYRRFMDIEKAMAQAKEAQVEASLEKVRAQALGMRKPEDLLNVCEVLFKELQSLGFSELRNAMVNIHNDEKRTFVNYDYSDEIGKTFTPLYYDIHPVIKKQISQIRKADNAFSETIFKGKDLESWKTFRKSRGEKEDKRIKNSTALYYYFYSIGTGSIGISTFHAIGEEKLDLLKRFRNVFAFAYRRYMDVAMAEAQAREAQIELALERVRARTMAMQHSEELAETVTVMFEQFKVLGEQPERMAIEIVNEKEKVFEIWATQHGGSQLNLLIKISLDEPHVMQKMYKAWKSKTKSITIDLQGKGLDEYFNFLKKAGLPVQRKIFGKRRVQNVATFSKGILTIITPEPRPQETIALLERFASVFDGTYTRFLDLQKAEAQSREAQIELGLERVRARAMAMQHSNELSDLVDTVFKELTKLDFALNWCIINIIDAPSLTNMVWAANPETNKPPESYLMKFEDYPFHHSMMKGYQERKTKQVYVLEGNEKKTYDDYLFNKTEWRRVPKEVQAASRAMKRYVATFTFSNFGGLQTVGEEYLSEESLDILSRFGKVFDLTYTRFNDLQKAETQAREAQIELGLERVRARAMAMQKSDELADAAQLLYHEFGNLGISTFSCGYMFIDEAKQTQIAWVVLPDGSLLRNFIVFPVTGDHVLENRYKDWKEKKPLHIYEVQGEVNKEHHRFLSNYVPPFVVENIFSKIPHRIIFNCANFSDGYLLILATEPFSPDEQQTIIRFAKVFEQTYTRFLDLQKAEAQTREAQINLAVERVRARALAMYKSDEILELVFKLKQEMMDLDIPNVVAATIHLKEKDGNYTMWDLTAMEYAEGKLHQPMVVHYRLEELDPNLFIKRMWDNTASYFLVVQDEENFKYTIQFLRDHDREKEADESEAYLKNAGIKYGYHPTIPLQNGRMCIDLLEPPSAEIEQILTKMGAAFDLAYKRFEDLKNSEAQLKEAQIEAALERVRSRSMAMHKSEELKEVIKIVYQQIRQLNIHLDHAGFVVDYKPKGDWHFWIADEQEIPSKITHPYFESVWANQFNEAKEKGEDFFTTNLNFEEKNKFYTELLSYVPGLPEASKDFYLSCPGLAASTVLLESVGLYIENFSGTPYSDKENTTLLRFGKVFQQSYTRFLDLQKAEEQTREAKIEVSLERVRSRAMAMHKTGELLDAAELIYRELSALEVTSMNVSYAFVDGKEEQASYYSVNPVDGKTLPFPFVFPHTETDVMLSLLSSWKKQEPFNVIELDEKATLKHQTYIGEHIQQQIAKNNPEIPFTVEAFLAISPKKAVIYNFNFTQGYIFIIGSTRLTTEQEQILLRFTKVFELTYRRFLDLKQAEAQAREAQIELALERVRARTMAMQHSEELQDTSLILFQQLKELGEPAEQCTIGIIKESEGVVEISATLHGNKMQQTFRHKIDEPFVMNKMFRTWKDQKKTLVLELKDEELQKYNQYRNELVGKETFPVKLLSGDRWIIHIAYFSKGMLALSTNEPRPAESLQLLERFAIVFEQTYIRFLDLQKAEAQAREAQIENALEKVRSRTMAMQKSEELPEAANVLFLQVQSLGIPAWSCGYNILAADKKSSTCIMSSEGEIQVPFVLPLTEHWSLLPWYEAIQNDLDFFVYGQGGEDLIEHYKYLATVPGLEKVFQQFDDAGISLPANQINHLVRFTNGFLLFITYESVPNAHEIFKRFGKVFEQTYTRFLDLQKAEAQARVAKIEMALERVRSRSLAMHSSGELGEVVTVVLNNLMELGYIIDHGAAAHLAIFSEGTKDFFQWSADPALPHPVRSFIPYTDLPILTEFWDARQKGHDFFAKVYSFEEKNTWFNFAFEHSDLKHIPGELKKLLLESETYAHSVAIEKNSAIIINSITGNQLSENQIDILRRFSKVFEQAYIRFLDLQKAEAQTREAQIEAGLERVRSRSLAMHTTSELQEVIHTVYKELLSLNIAISGGSFIAINSEIETELRCWGSGGTANTSEEVHIPLYKKPFCTNLINGIKKGPGFFTEEFTQQEKKHFFNFLFKHEPWSKLDTEQKNETLSSPGGYTRSCCVSQHTSIFIINHFGEKFSESDNDILKRFGKVFEQAYSRFLDLQKAEAQAREAEIELALERVRAKTMAMQRSDELVDVATVLFQRVKALGVPQWNCGFNIWNIGDNEFTYYPGSPDGIISPSPCKISLTEHPVFMRFDASRKRGDELLVYEKEGEEQADHYRYMLSLPGVGDLLQSMLDAGFELPKFQIDHLANFAYGNLIFITYEHFPAMHDVFKRFAKVFEQTYTRFLDLQKAEAQTREAQINLAVERVRARALAMYKSEEILELVFKLKQEMMNLDIPNVVAATIHLKEKDGNYTMWDLTAMEATEGKLHQPMVVHYRLEELDPKLFIKKMWDNAAPYFLVVQDEQGFKRTIQFLRNHGKTKEADETEVFLQLAGTKHAYHPTIPLHNGRMCIDLLEPPSDEIEMILTKMGAAFDLAYKRFEDLKNSEAQLREAQIEGALEKVRSRTMGMQQSYELGDVATVLFKELNQLVDDLWTCGFVLCKKDRGEDEWWLSTGDGFIPAFYLPNTGDATHANIYDAWKKGETYHTEQLEGKALQQHYDWLMNIPVSKKIFEDMLAAGFILPSWQKLHCAYFSYGYLVMITQVPCAGEQIFKRFAQVFDQTYTRFLDLQKAEFQARQAKIETALEKVRARALAMQQPEELIYVAEVLRHEMGLLGVEELETCSIYIHDETIKRTECWYALKDIRSEEKKLVSDHFPLNLNDTWVGREMGKFYGSDAKQVSILMHGAHRKEWINYCEEKSIPFRGYYGAVIPDRTYHLYKFSHGAIGAASAGDISAESWDLLQRTASVFSLAYSRFKDLTQARFDLQRLKEEKQRAETALSELQTTQKQLIQSEKMASLGELTAGIAHEIQNPLNFVNNFSEVSKEMLDEMRAAIEKGDTTEAKEIMNDVIQNLEKINHHGKRADGIVKGMLQHSRSSSGIKEPTNINTLADEYLRLAYHGLRTKDKSFNAIMKTVFDESIGTVNIIPQDIGRVILNLITNAFYVVNEKKNQGLAGYEPTVTVKTLKNPPSEGGVEGVLISVKDNGNGIPEKILDKIFQPFFTTKPTGQGTGLGLSLAYDIVKAHGGELKVETREGVGSTFIIELPVV